MRANFIRKLRRPDRILFESEGRYMRQDLRAKAAVLRPLDHRLRGSLAVDYEKYPMATNALRFF
jgi:hypothetical protein